MAAICVSCTNEMPNDFSAHVWQIFFEGELSNQIIIRSFRTVFESVALEWQHISIGSIAIIQRDIIPSATRHYLLCRRPVTRLAEAFYFSFVSYANWGESAGLRAAQKRTTTMLRTVLNCLRLCVLTNFSFFHVLNAHSSWEPLFI